MKTLNTRLGIGLVAVMISMEMAGCASRSQNQETSEAATAGAAMQQAGVMSQSNYVRQHALAYSVIKTHTISDEDLTWTLAQLNEEKNSAARARAFNILADIRPMSGAQKSRILPAIAPYLSSSDRLDQAGARRVQSKVQAAG